MMNNTYRIYIFITFYKFYATVTGLLQYILPLNKTKFVKSDEISNHLQSGC
ncbi:conserved hypothetical phage-related protein [Clostridium phage D-1873]|uniref:Conserved hypothetical phage-related protein n=1 Tax=Clostridium botulinum D str. 1873 TaxID=592027 RepID=A0A9P2LKI4_CLOBO|nr:hypothetical protein [Clostridium botulinum]EES90386.1 conserved hypothetical phage-related protein [Clostridium phage D-1873]QPW56434.1 hypothetical protein IRP61_11175 [Clostridium botulinum]